MKRIVLAVIALSMVLGMTSCGSGVSQDQYDKVVSERDALRTSIVELESQTNSQKNISNIKSELIEQLPEYVKLSDACEISPDDKLKVLQIWVYIDGPTPEKAIDTISDTIFSIAKSKKEYDSIYIECWLFGRFATIMLDVASNEITTQLWGDVKQTNDSDRNKHQSIDGIDKSTGEQVVFEQNNIKITFTGISESYFGIDVNFTIENGTSENITVQARNVSVNDVMTKPIFSCDVAASKKAKDAMTFDEDDIDGGTMNNMEFNFHIYSDNDGIIDSDTISLNF